GRHRLPPEAHQGEARPLAPRAQIPQQVAQASKAEVTADSAWASGGRQPPVACLEQGADAPRSPRSSRRLTPPSPPSTPPTLPPPPPPPTSPAPPCAATTPCRFLCTGR